MNARQVTCTTMVIVTISGKATPGLRKLLGDGKSMEQLAVSSDSVVSERVRRVRRLKVQSPWHRQCQCYLSADASWQCCSCPVSIAPLVLVFNRTSLNGESALLALTDDLHSVKNCPSALSYLCFLSSCNFLSSLVLECSLGIVSCYSSSPELFLTLGASSEVQTYGSRVRDPLLFPP